MDAEVVRDCRWRGGEQKRRKKAVGRGGCVRLVEERHRAIGWRGGCGGGCVGAGERAVRGNRSRVAEIR